MTQWSCQPAPELQVCSRCIYDSRVPGIQFDAHGECSYCAQVDRLCAEFGTGSDKGRNQFWQILDEIKSDGRGKKYDCVIGVSGGTDSSYLVHLAKKEWGLRPLAVHYDNTWNSATATQNIRKVLQALDVDLFTHVIDNRESDDIFRAFLLAGVPEFDAATDLALAETMYRAASRHGLRYMLEGHSFLTEGITPLGKNYFDGKYIKSIHQQYGQRPMVTYPLMTFSRFMWWTAVARIRKVRPFWYLDYTKEDARAILEHDYGWEYYGGHHLENRVTAFAHSYYLPRKFGADLRNNTLAALVRMGKLSREEAIVRYSQPPIVDEELVKYLMKRLRLNNDEFSRIMAERPRYWYEFQTYKRRFEMLRPVFGLMARAGLVPMSFYLKYCFPARQAK
jgi:N-acetyl sugar amidotransferase